MTSTVRVGNNRLITGLLGPGPPLRNQSLKELRDRPALFLVTPQDYTCYQVKSIPLVRFLHFVYLGVFTSEKKDNIFLGLRINRARAGRLREIAKAERRNLNDQWELIFDEWLKFTGQEGASPKRSSGESDEIEDITEQERARDQASKSGEAGRGQRKRPPRSAGA